MGRAGCKKIGRQGGKAGSGPGNTLPGVPLLYNGQEIGNAKTLKLFEKIPIDWRDGDDFRKL